MLRDPQTEDEIERWVEMQIDRLDMKYTIGRLSQEEYEIAVKEVSAQASKYYEKSDVLS
jgi:hypothetical protein